MEHSKTVSLLQLFVCAFVISLVAFVVSLFLSFLWCLEGGGREVGVGGGTCFVIVAFPGYLHLHCFRWAHMSEGIFSHDVAQILPFR